MGVSSAGGLSNQKSVCVLETALRLPSHGLMKIFTHSQLFFLIYSKSIVSKPGAIF